MRAVQSIFHPCVGCHRSTECKYFLHILRTLWHNQICWILCRSFEPCRSCMGIGSTIGNRDDTHQQIAVRKPTSGFYITQVHILHTNPWTVGQLTLTWFCLFIEFTDGPYLYSDSLPFPDWHRLSNSRYSSSWQCMSWRGELTSSSEMFKVHHIYLLLWGSPNDEAVEKFVAIKLISQLQWCLQLTFMKHSAVLKYLRTMSWGSASAISQIPLLNFHI
jgi:hypothetical protein